MFCPKCGSEVREGYIHCTNCGAMVGGGYLGKPIEEGNPYAIMIDLGYLFALLGWLLGPVLGLVVGAYLLKEEHPKAKLHGERILILTVFMIPFWLVIGGT